MSSRSGTATRLDVGAAEEAGSTLDLERLLRYAVALLIAGAGFIHFDAAGDHPAHAHLSAFFAFLGVAQILFGATLAWRPRPRLLGAGMVATAAVVGVWVLSRTMGIPLVEGAQDVEPLGLKDALTTFMELLALGGGALLAVLPTEARRAVLPSSERIMAGLLAGTLALTLPGILAGHGHGEAHGVHGSGLNDVHGDGEAAGDGHGHGGRDGDGQGKGTGHGHAAGDETASAAGDGAGHGHDDRIPVSSGHVEHQEVTTVAGHLHGATGTTGDDSAMGHDHGAPGHQQHHRGAVTAAASDDALVTHRQQMRAFRAAPGEEMTARVGPFVIPPASMNEGRHASPVLSNTILTQLPPPCRDCYLTALAPNLVNADGSVANFDSGAWLHHQVTFASDENDPTCPRGSTIGWLGKRIFASGNERTVGVYPDGFGYYVGNDDWWSGIFEIMNTSDEPQTVYFETQVKYLPGDSDTKPLTPIWLDIDNCSDSEVDVPAGRTTTAWEWESNVTGRIVTAAGHVHNGGLFTDVTNASTGERVCKSVAGYGNRPGYHGNIDTMSICAWDRIGTIREGQTIRLETVYDSDEPLAGVMGIVMMFVYETDELRGGSRPPAGHKNPSFSGQEPPAGGGHDH